MIPVIDISDAVAGCPRPDTVEAIRHAVQEVGFFQIVGHGVDLALIDKVYRVANDLMMLPESTKQPWRHPHPFRGWERRPTHGDVIVAQRLQVCNIDSPEDALGRGIDPRMVDYFQTNVWPEVPGLKESILALVEAEKRVGATVMSLFALALGLDAEYFAPFFLDEVSNFAINHYEGRREVGGSDIALGEHKDSGTLTVLHQRGGYSGLQVRMSDGEMLTVPPREDSFVINVGELMEHWTNDKFKATLHRVVLPDIPGTKRTSLTLFLGPGITTIIAPLEQCVGDEPVRYEPVTPYEWESQYFMQNGISFGVPAGGLGDVTAAPAGPVPEAAALRSDAKTQ